MLPELSDERRIELFRQMWLVRRWEERLIQLAADGESFGHYHVYVGQEAIGIPVLAALRADDLVFTTHRNHGHLLGRGADPGRLLAEVLGRASGLNGGKGGTLDACAPELGVPHTSAIVGGALPIAAGAGGAASETLNVAALWALPVVFMCENNSPEALGAAAGGYSASVTA